VSGAARILLYNWPTYALTWIGGLVALVLAPRFNGLALFVGLGAAIAIGWSLFSLLVSFWIYDRSGLVAGAWLRPLLPARVEAWTAVDTGLDAEVMLDDVLPGTCLGRLDVYDGERVRAPSVQRARAITPRSHAAIRARPGALPLPDGSCDVVAAVFAAHEVRDRTLREQLFAEMRRLLRDGGRVLLVEHVRDSANFVAFGPGFVHFQPRAEWLRLAERAGLRIAAETRVTPFVMALALERRG
jgi:SAM-dependent methyltransferase